MDNNKKVLFALFGVFSLLFLFGCTGSSTGTSGGLGAPERTHLSGTDLVPDGVAFMASLKVDKILADADIAKAYSEANEGKKLSDELKTVSAVTGIDLTKVRTVYIFGKEDKTSTKANEYMGGIVDSDLDSAAILEAIKKNATVTQLSSSGTTYYKVVSKDNSSDVNYATFLGKTIVFGGENVVLDVIQVDLGSKKSIKGGLLEKSYRGVNTNALIAGAIDSSMLSGALDSTSPGFASNMTTLGFSLDKAGTAIDFIANAEFSNAASGQEANDAITGMVKMYGAYIPETAVKTKAFMKSIKISQTGSTLKLSISTTLQDLTDVSKELGQLSAGSESTETATAGTDA